LKFLAAEREERSAGQNVDGKFPFPYPFPSAASPDFNEYFGVQAASSGMPSATFMMPDRTCWTPEGKRGICGTLRACYPHVKLPDLSNLETWVIGVSGTCNYVEQDGRNVSNSSLQ
jgi:hypothetical protein